MICYPHAKINLTLSVLGRRADGYHEIDTVFMPVSLFDELCAEYIPEDTLRFSCADGAPAGEDNLVCRAFRMMKAEYGFSGGLAVRLVKHIPSQAGLGGGSADAAAMLQVCNTLFGLGQSRETLAALGGRLGADVAALIYDGPTRGTGTGTELSPVKTGLRLPLLIIKPQAACSTPLMYRQIDRLRGDKAADASAAGERSEAMVRALSEGDREAVCRFLYNDFEAAADLPEIKEAHAALRLAGAEGILLSGSGSAVFGIFAEEAGRDHAFKSLQGHFEVYACESMREEHE